MYEIILPHPGEPEIEINTPAGQVDLHSFAEFRSFQYDITGNLVLRWEVIGDQCSKLDGQLVKWIELRFTDVSQLLVTPRDPEVPQSEDSALEHYQLVEQRPGRLRMLFEFIGGMSIDVTSQAVMLAQADHR
jgi:hypothetical protein